MNSRRLMGAYPKAKDHEPIIAWCIAAESGHLSPVRVNLYTFGRGDAAIHVRYASNSNQGGESQRNVAMCRERTSAGLFDHLIGGQLKRIRNVQSSRSRSLAPYSSPHSLGSSS